MNPRGLLRTAALVAFLMLPFAVGCGASDTICEPGELCSCEGIGSCVSTCAGGDCDFLCDGIGSCDFECPEGGCDAWCEGTGSCILSCPGGDCDLHCEVTGSCTLVDCPEGRCQTR